MKTKEELEQDIIRITTEINQVFPELSKYLKEINVKVSEKDQEDVNIENLKEYYSTLEEMVKKYSKTHTSKDARSGTESSTNQDYPASEDIYAKSKKEMEINPADISKKKISNEAAGTMNEKAFEDDMSGDDLDIPGAELDDQQESVGSEDEENNYYSLGGDNHNDIDERNS